MFTNSDFLKWKYLITRLLSCPILVYNMDRLPNEASSITKVVNMVLQYWDHSKQAIFMVTSVGRQLASPGFMNTTLRLTSRISSPNNMFHIWYT